MKDQTIMNYPKVEINFNPRFPSLKETSDKTKIDVRYALIPPFVYAHVYWDAKKSELKYDIEEPELNSEEASYRSQIVLALRDMIDTEQVVGKNWESLMDYIDKRFRIIATELGLKISYESYRKIYYYLCRDFMGFNEVEPILRDYFVEDIECNGASTPVYLVHRKFRNMKTNLVFKDIEYLASFIEKLAQRCGKYVSYSNPILDGSLPDGSRVNATYSQDISSKGPTFTIRKFTATPWTPPQLIEFQTLSPEMLAYLWLLVQYKMNILIAGGTSSGKTTLLNAMAFFITPEARIVTIEDTKELNIPKENWLPSVVRSATGIQGQGEIDLFALLKSSFRQNPDYVIVGEVRGKEAYVLFQGMASGHSSISTIHADSVDTVIKRLETPPIELSPTLMNILDCVCVMTHAIVNKKETRKLREIVEIINVNPDGIASTNTPFIWNAHENQFYFKKSSKIFEKISKRYGIPVVELQEEFRKRTLILYQMYKQKITDYKKFQELVNEYYKNPQAILRKYMVE